MELLMQVVAVAVDQCGRQQVQLATVAAAVQEAAGLEHLLHLQELPPGLMVQPILVEVEVAAMEVLDL
jgi:hypothetical protein